MTTPVIKPFKAIFFDWDNTLVDTWPVLLKSLNKTLEHFGLPKSTMEELKIRAQLSTREGFPKLFGENSKKAQSIFYQAISENKGDLQIYEGSASLIRSLKKSGYIIAIISNKKRDLLHQELEQFEVSADLALGSGDSVYDKPHPEMGLIALNHFGLQSHEAVYIGDSITDWIFAKNLNMQAIAIGNDAYDGPLLARFKTINDSLEKFLGCIAE
jgi:phosphoglycolate phosphatase